MTFLRTAALSCLLLLATALPAAHGAQDATVTSNKAAIRESPDPDARTIETRSAGETLRVSKFSKEGWFKVRTKGGQYGWIWQSDVAVFQDSAAVRAANLEFKGGRHEKRGGVRGPTLFLRLVGNAFGIVSSDITNAMGLKSYHMYPGYGGYGEFAIKLDERLRGALRVGTFASTSTVGNNYTINTTGMPVMVGLDTDVSLGISWDISAGVYGGMSLANTLDVAADDFNSPNSFSASSSALAFLINFSTKYWFSRRMSFVSELGFYFSQTSSQKISTAFNGDGPFRGANGSLGGPRIRHLGPQLGLGLQFAW